MSRFSVGLLVLLLAATPAAAIDYTSQYRAVVATAGSSAIFPPAVVDLKEMSALGPWSETAIATYVLDAENGAGATTTQTSDLANQLISMSGTLSGSGTYPCCGGGARSDLVIEFSLASDSPYVSMLSTTGDTASSYGLSSGSTALPFDPNGSGVLAAGTYGLSVIFSAEGGGGTSESGTYMFSLSIIPEPTSAVLILMGGLLLVAVRRNRHGC
jgi:hypothetical protein